MISRVTIAAAMLALAGTVAAQDKRETPGNPPRILVASSIDGDGNLVLVSYRTIYIGFDGASYNNRTVNKFSLDEVQISTVGGKEISIDAARELIGGKETPILASSWRSPLPPHYRKLLADDALHFVFRREAPAWREIQDPSRPVR